MPSRSDMQAQVANTRESLQAANDPANSLTIYNAASSPKTLGIMLVIAIIGVPLVLAYTASIYWVFRGKVKLDRFSY